MAYSAVQADETYINEFNYPLLAHINQPGNQYLHIIPNVATWEKEKYITQHWSGVVLYPEKNKHWQNDENTKYQKEKLLQTFSTGILIMLALSIYLHTALQFNNIYLNVFGLLSLFGLVISVFLLGSELGYQNEIVKQVCGAVSKGGCEKVLKSKFAKAVWGVTPADASLLYFCTQFVLFNFSPHYAGLTNVLLLISIIVLPVAGWSIYTQAAKLKQWCALCLAIVGILLFQALSVWVVNRLIIFPPLSHFTVFLAEFVILLIFLLPIKTLIKTNITNQAKLTELKKWKTDTALFEIQLQQQPKVDTIIWENDLILGNPYAPIRITVACNPYCGPCAKAHKQLEEMLLNHKDKLCVQLRFLCKAENNEDKRTLAVKSILQKATEAKANNEIVALLHDWFEWMNYEKWMGKWNALVSIDVTTSLLQHEQWVAKAAIAFTPTFFINGKQLPGRYSLTDFEKLLPQFAESIVED